MPAHPVVAGASSPHAERAMVFDDRPRMGGKDLQLSLEGERKAEALARYAQGVLLEEDADTEQATKAYLRAIALDPSNVDLALKLTRVYVRRGEPTEAIEILKDAIKASPRAPQPPLTLAYLYLKSLNKPDLALKYATQALELDPANGLAYRQLVEIYSILGQPAKAQALLERGSKVESKDARFWLELGGTFAGYYLRDGVKAASPENLKRTGAIFQKALAAAGNDAPLIERVANFYFLTEQLPDAATLYERVLAQDPTDSNAADNLARCYLALGQRDKAIAALEQSIKVNPTQEATYEQLGALLEQSEQFERAADQYEQCLRLDPDKATLYVHLAELMLETNRVRRPERAVEIFTRARKRFPGEPEFSTWLARALFQAKQFQQSVTAFEQALLEARSNQERFLSNGIFYFYYGIAAEQAGLFEKAAAQFKRCLDVASAPELIAQASNYLGYMWIERNENLEEAGALVRRALDLQPSSGAFLDSFGWYLYRTNQFDKALTQLLQAAANIETPDPVVFEHLGDTYQKLDNSSQALAYWQKAAGLEAPTEADKDRLAKKIESLKAQLAKGNPPPPPDPVKPAQP